MTPLDRLIRAEIAANGPMDTGAFMALALAHPRHGYYVTRDPFGQAGDFVTAPEISQMFGELLGLWSVAVWRGLGAPDPFRLIELGPGRGTLMADALRAASRDPGFLKAAQVTFVETSPVLRQAQGRALAPTGAVPAWADDLNTVPDDAPVILLANEFLDALPSRQLVFTRGQWRDRVIGHDAGTDSLVFGAGPGPSAHAALLAPDVAARGGEGMVAEICPQALTLGAALGGRLATRGGAALFIDYGPASSGPGDSLQAVKAHRPVPVLERVGEADLTAHVDFARFAEAARQAGADAHGPVAQGDFLGRLGIAVRAEQLCHAVPGKAQAIRAALTRLTAPDQMGTLFKALALTARGGHAPPGFEA